MFRLNYIGSKKSLLNTLDKVFINNINKDDIFADLFAGTGIVSKFVHDKYRCKIISNDIQYYAYILNKASLENYSKSDIDEINKLIEIYNNLKPIQGFFSKNYGPPKRMYFTELNASKIDALRTKLEQDNLNDKIYIYMLANIISSADKVANTSAVYASYLKEFKKSALNELKLEVFNKDILKNNKGNKSYNKDILDLNIKADIIYLDPPYNNRQYSDNYHILETIAKYDNPKIHGITGLRDDLVEHKSLFSTANAIEAFRNLINSLNCKTLILSYNDEGIMSLKEIKLILKKKFGYVKLYKFLYKKFIAQDNVDRKMLYEYIFLAKN